VIRELEAQAPRANGGDVSRLPRPDRSAPPPWAMSPTRVSPTSWMHACAHVPTLLW